ncbi:hypothetical protein [Aeromicrobium sp. UC242_57]|uniref:hypothetical protein n=1 Tax=Aeromicrobium sp. UC242_57 TaxID=3374624 RepID=UPI003791053B
MSTPPAWVEKPTTMIWAVRLMLLGAGLGLLSLIYSLATMGDLKGRIRADLIKDDPKVTASTVDSVYAVSIGVAVIIGLVGAMLWLWMAWKNNEGRSWARIVSTVLGGLNVFGALTTFSSGNADSLSVTSTVISLVLAVVVLVLLWRPESTRFYDESRARGTV